MPHALIRGWACPCCFVLLACSSDASGGPPPFLGRWQADPATVAAASPRDFQGVTYEADGTFVEYTSPLCEGTWKLDGALLEMSAPQDSFHCVSWGPLRVYYDVTGNTLTWRYNGGEEWTFTRWE